jgi:hypothetical protein
MIDLNTVDELFDAAMSTIGTPPGVALFNRAVAAPLSRLPEMVRRETGEDLPAGRVADLVSAGWIPDVPASEGEGPGVPLYLPSRIGLFLELERQGYSEDELRALADYEEGMIDGLLAADDLEYLENDRELLLRHLRLELEAWDDRQVTPADVEQRLARTRSLLERVEKSSPDLISDAERLRWAKLAFRVRMLDEQIRLHLLSGDRRKVRDGYSPLIVFGREIWTGPGEGTFEQIVWASTVDRPWSTADGVEVPIRVPGFFLRGGEVTTSRTLLPPEYRRMWRKHDLDGYRAAYGMAHDVRCCRHCREPLPEGANSRRIYCGERCRAAARQKRWRTRNPDKYIDSQRRYWSS